MNNEQALALFDGLTALRTVQKQNLKTCGHDAAMKEVYQIYGTALAIEVSEFVNELDWKPWKNKEPDMEKVVEEFVDVLHFIGSWLAILGHLNVSISDVVSEFARKQELNQARLAGKVEHYGVGGTEWTQLSIDR